MNPQAGLSFEQAPPFSLPLRFFLSAPLFLLAAGALVAFFPQALSGRWAPQALALTHALTLGFLAMTMLGALTQMLPVVAGSPLPAPRLVAWLSHVPLVLGTLALLFGFLLAAPAAFAGALFLLLFGFAAFLAAAAVSLARAAGSATVTGMRLAAACLALTIALGAALALQRAGGWTLPAFEAVLAAHVAFGLLGWVLLLVVGVAFQVVPMFQMTPPYPMRLARWLSGGVAALLLLRAAAPWLPAALARAADAGIAGGILLFAVATLRLQAQRRRKLRDVTLDFWRIGMAGLIASVGLWGIAQAVPGWAQSPAYPVLLGVAFIGGFAVSVVCGMLYKIVPFLAWFHLQAQLQAKAGTIPNMKQMMDEKLTRLQLSLHAASCVLLAGAALWPRLLHLPAGLALAASAALLWINLFSALRRFLRHGGRLS